MFKDDRDEILLLFEQENLEKAPYVCPVCGKKGAHIFYYQHNDNEIGTGWAWCSECKQYAHVRCKIPKWWINCQINIADLNSSVNELEKNKELIDQHINSLQKNI